MDEKISLHSLPEATSLSLTDEMPFVENPASIARTTKRILFSNLLTSILPDIADALNLNGLITAVSETSGPTTLTIGDIADGQGVKRDGTNLIGYDIGGGGGAGWMADGQIVTSASSGSLVVALKHISGNDPSSGSPVTARIGNVNHIIESALSVTIRPGTSWFNVGSYEHNAQDIDFFARLGYNATDGVTLGVSRIPYGGLYSDFSATSTNEKYCKISNIAHASANDPYENIGRFNATLSGSATSYLWTIPATSIVINRPIYETRLLTYSPSYSANASMTYTSVTTNLAKYQIIGGSITIYIGFYGTTGGTLNNILYFTHPFTPNSLGVNPLAISVCNGFDAASETVFIDYDSSVPTKLRLSRTAFANWTAGASRGLPFSGKGNYLI